MAALPLIALLLAAANPTPAWIAGSWAPDAAACGEADSVRYDAAGSYGSMGDAGWWWLREGELRQFSNTAKTGFSFRIERMGADAMRLTDPGGETLDWQRCP